MSINISLCTWHKKRQFHSAWVGFFFSSFSVRQVLERCRLQKRLSSCTKALGSDVELSAESDTVLQPDGEPEEEEDKTSQSAGKEEPVKEQDLQAQVCVQHKLLWWIVVLARKALGVKSLAKVLGNNHIPVYAAVLICVRAGSLFEK